MHIAYNISPQIGEPHPKDKFFPQNIDLLTFRLPWDLRIALILRLWYAVIQSAMLLERNTFTPLSQKVEMFVQKLIYLESDFVPSTEKIVSGKTGEKFIPSSKEFKNIFMCIIVHTFQVREIHSIEGYILSLYHYLSAGLNS